MQTTYNDYDVKMCRIVIGLINQADFNLKAKQIMEGSQAFSWIVSHVNHLEKNVMEIKKVIEHPIKESNKKAKKKKAS